MSLHHGAMDWSDFTISWSYLFVFYAHQIVILAEYTHNVVFLKSNIETCLREFANNKGAEQPEHPRSLLSTLVICLLESVLSRLATSEISTF